MSRPDGRVVNVVLSCEWIFILIAVKSERVMDSEKIVQLRIFVESCKSAPALIHLPELRFFKDWLLR